MNLRKFGLFVSIKYLEKNIETYEFIFDFLKKNKIKPFKSDLIDIKKIKSKNLTKRKDPIVAGTKRQIRNIDFAIADFTDKSRFVFFQTITALESKIPVLCIYKEGTKSNIPTHLISYGQDFVKIKGYKQLNDLKTILENYIKNVEPPKRRFNIVLKTSTLKQLEQLCEELDMSKAELIRKVILKEYRNIFGKYN